MRTLFVWTGGALFVASIASFAVVYGVTLGHQPPPSDVSMWPAVLVNVSLFSAFALHHSVMARTGAKAWISRIVPPALERSVYVWIASSLFLAVLWLWRPLPGIAWEATGPAAWIGRGVQLYGIWLTFRGAAVIDPLDLAGIRQASGDTRPVEFKVVGPFRLVRHPIYLGWMLLVFGSPVMTASRLVMAIVSSTYLVLAIPWEERSLVQAYGDRYRNYQRQVRSRVLPGIW